MNEPILAYFDKFSFTKNSLIYLQKTKKRLRHNEINPIERRTNEIHELDCL